MPLAIELAAANARTLSVRQMLTRLDDQFQMLAYGARSARPRHQTLRAAIDWSHAQLSAAEQAVFRCLAVFRGDFALEAAEAVCAAASKQREVLPLLIALVGKSLVLAETSGTHARYRMLESLRRYADEKPRAAGESDAARRRHAEYFLALAESVGPALRSGKRTIALSVLGAEDHNLRAVLRWSLAGDPSIALRLVWQLGWYWYFRGQISEAREWIQAALDTAEGVEPAIRARALWAGGTMAWVQGDYAASLTLLTESRATWLAAQDSDASSVGFSLIALGLLLGLHQRYAEAETAMQDGLAHFEPAADHWGEAFGYYWYGEILRFQNESPASRLRFERSLRLFRELDDPWGASLALQGLGIASLRDGELVEARAHFEGALAPRRAAADRWLMAQTMHALGVVARAQGDLTTAQACFAESSDIYREVADRMGLAHTLFNLATVVQAGDPVRAAALYTECVELFQALDKPEWAARAQAALSGR